MKTHLLRRGGLLAVMVASVVLVSAGSASAAPGDASAFGVNVDVTLLGADAVHLGPLAAANADGPTTGTFAKVNLPGILTTGVITTEATRDDVTGVVHSKASTADVKIPLLKALGSKVGATAIEAECTATQDGITGASTLADVNLGSLGDIPVHPAANTTLSVKLGIIHIATVILNEQIKNTDGSLTVNALHVKLLGGAVGALGSGDVIVSSATCGPAAPPTPLASGAGMWIAFGLLGIVAVPVGTRIVRKRHSASTTA